MKLLKIGGSVITDKSASSGILKKNIIANIAKELSESRANCLGKLILVNGGGSFGHPLAKQYRLDTNYCPIGAIKTHSSVKELNRVFVQSLIQRGVPAVSVDPMSCVVCNNGKITHMETRVITQMLKAKLVPVLFGDVVMDRTKQACILSGDQIATYLAQQLSISVIGAGSKEDGVYGPDKKIIKKINNKNFYKIKKDITSSEHTDVTGGMLGKVQALLTLKNTTSYIFNGEKKGNIEAFLQDRLEKENNIYTKVTYL